MKLPPIKIEESKNVDGTPQPKGFWTMILSSTPVVLTVVATILAGLSSSEMTTAQYHRSMAAQNQSKAGDQWNFFQAKRIRGTSMQTAIDMLHALTEPATLDIKSLEAAAEQAVRDLQRVESAANQLVAKIAALPASARPGMEPLHQAAIKLQQLAASKRKEAESARSRLGTALAGGNMVQALGFFTSEKLPPVELGKPSGDDKLAKVIRAIENRRPDSEIAETVKLIALRELEAAVETADGNVLAMERANKPVSAALDELDKILRSLVSLSREVQRSVKGIQAIADELPVPSGKSLQGDGKSVQTIAYDPSSREAIQWTEIVAAVNGASRAAAGLKSTLTELNNDFKAARYDYAIRRYEAEARLNQQAAVLYEVQVRHSSIMSERHRGRSKLFFYGMLVAQAGVTIASFSLALKHRSLMWGLAALAGIGAIIFSGYVYLYQ